MTAFAMEDLPDPDSPTRPRVPALGTLRLISSTTVTAFRPKP